MDLHGAIGITSCTLLECQCAVHHRDPWCIGHCMLHFARVSVCNAPWISMVQLALQAALCWSVSVQCTLDLPGALGTADYNLM
jgi:hypothetical protein